MIARRVLLDTRVLNTRQPTGLSRYAATLFEHLVGRGRCEYLVADGGSGSIPGAHSLPFDVPLGDAAGAARWLTAICRLYDVDLVFSPYLPVPKLAGTPVVLTVHDLIALEHPEWFADASVHRFFAGPLRASARDVDRIITGSDAAAASIVEHYGGRPRSHHGRAPRCRAHVLSGTAARPGSGSTSLVGSDPFILSVATLEPRKNIARLVEAFEIVRDHQPGIRRRLVLVGRLGWRCGPILERISVSPLSRRHRPSRSRRRPGADRSVSIVCRLCLREPGRGIRLARARGTGVRGGGGHIRHPGHQGGCGGRGVVCRSGRRDQHRLSDLAGVDGSAGGRGPA